MLQDLGGYVSGNSSGRVAQPNQIRGAEFPFASSKVSHSGSGDANCPAKNIGLSGDCVYDRLEAGIGPKVAEACSSLIPLLPFGIFSQTIQLRRVLCRVGPWPSARAMCSLGPSSGC